MHFVVFPPRLQHPQPGPVSVIDQRYRHLPRSATPRQPRRPRLRNRVRKDGVSQRTETAARTIRHQLVRRR